MSDDANTLGLVLGAAVVRRWKQLALREHTLSVEQCIILAAQQVLSIAFDSDDPLGALDEFHELEEAL